jgi:2',3'-cyclic-nucleotide 2'-phosphodiesterase (5'-nucleotidase family)
MSGYSMDVKSSLDSTFYNIAKPYKIKIDNEMNEVLTYSKQEMKKGQPESLLGNWTADICLKIAEKNYDGNIDLAMFNNGGLRSSLSKGKITKREVFKLMPFENELVVVDLNKDEFKLLVEYYIKTGGQPIGFSDQFSLNDSIFSILTTDYLANGGDKMIFYKTKVTLLLE